MKNLAAILIAVASGISLIVASPVAKRADGSLKYVRADTRATNNMFSPPNDVCIPIQGGAVELANDSDATVFLYSNAGCSGGYDIVGVGAVWSAPGISAQGIRLGSAP